MGGGELYFILKIKEHPKICMAKLPGNDEILKTIFKNVMFHDLN